MKCPKEYRKDYKKIILNGLQDLAILAITYAVFILLILKVEGVI